MGRFFRNYEVPIFLCALTLPGFAGIPSAQPEPSLKINVGVYNYERVPDAILTRAKQEATRVFARVGVETVWVDCATSPAERPKYPACQRLLQSGPLFLSLKILSRSMAEALHPRFPSTSYFGFAMLDTHGGFGSYASIFFHRVKQRAQKPLLPIHTVLGHVMAHEVGHLQTGLQAGHPHGSGTRHGARSWTPSTGLQRPQCLRHHAREVEQERFGARNAWESALHPTPGRTDASAN